jgi:hypothetical protein
MSSYMEKVISVHRKYQKKYFTIQIRIKINDIVCYAFDGEF